MTEPKPKRLLGLVRAELERRKSSTPAAPLAFIVAADGLPGTITSAEEAMGAAIMVRDDRRRQWVPIARNIANAVVAAASAANPRARFAAVMRVVVAPGDTTAEVTPTPAEPEDPAALTQAVLARAAERVAALRNRPKDTP